MDQHIYRHGGRAQGQARALKAYDRFWVGRGSDTMLFSLSWSVSDYLVKLADQRYPLPFFT